MKHLILIGLSHRTAPIDIRERLAFSETAIGEALRVLNQHPGLQEAMILSTCNRVEIIARGPRSDVHEEVKRFLSEYHSVPLSELESHLYSLREREVVHHIFRVASSLDSMVVGEPQILAQMKEAYRLARESGCIGQRLKAILPRAFFVAKRIRTETRVAESPVSVSSVAVELARKIFGDLAGKTVLVLGAGKMAQLAASSLIDSGVSRVLVTNRTEERGKNLAENLKGVFIRWEDLHQWLADADIVLVSTGASHYVLGRNEMQSSLKKRRYRPLFVIDVSVPRNVDPEVNDVENVFLFDIDDLQSVVDANLGERQKEADLAESLIQQEVDKFFQWLHIERTGPVISRLRTRLEDMVVQDLRKNQNGFTPEQVAEVEKMLLRAAHRIAHPMIMKIKDRGADSMTRGQTVELLRQIFQLEEDEGHEDSSDR